MSTLQQPARAILPLLFRAYRWVGLLVFFGVAVLLAGAASGLRLALLEPLQRDAQLAPQWYSVLALLLPASLAMLSFSTAQELAIRPALQLLPGLKHGLRRESLYLAGACAALAALGALLLQNQQVPFQVADRDTTAFGLGGVGLRTVPLYAGIALASLGFALGARFPQYTRSAWSWLAALALALSAPLALQLTSSLPVAILVIGWAFRATRVEAERLMRPEGHPLGLARRSPTEQVLASGLSLARSDTTLAPPARLVTEAEWLQAAEFERQAAGRSIFTWAGALQFTANGYALAFVGQVAKALADPVDPGQASSFSRLASVFAAQLIEPWASPSRAYVTVVCTLNMILVCQLMVVAIQCLRPLAGRFAYPLSRHQRAALALQLLQRAVLRQAGAQLAIGLLLAALLLSLSGQMAPRNLPPYVWGILLGLAVVPWMQRLWLRWGPRGAPGSWSDLLRVAAFGGVGLFGVNTLWTLWLASDTQTAMALWALCGAGLAALGFGTQARFLERHFGTAAL